MASENGTNTIAAQKAPVYIGMRAGHDSIVYDMTCNNLLTSVEFTQPVLSHPKQSQRVAGEIRRVFGDNRKLDDIVGNEEAIPTHIDDVRNNINHHRYTPLGATLELIKHAYHLGHDIPLHE